MSSSCSNTNNGGEASNRNMKMKSSSSPKPQADPHRNSLLYRKLLREEALREVVPLSIGACALLASSASNQAFPRLVGRLIDNDTRRQQGGWLFGLVVLGGGAASFLRTTMMRNAKDSIANRLRLQAFQAILSKDMEWFQEESHSPSAIANILGQDVDNISTMLTTTLANILRSCSSVFLSTYRMLVLDPALLGASLSVVPMIGAAAMLLRRCTKNLAHKQRQLANDGAAFVEERLVNIGMVQLANRQEDEIEHYRRLQQQNLGLDRSVAFQNGLLMGFLFVSSASGLLLVVHWGGKSVARGRMTSGELTSFATYSFLLGLGTSGMVQGLAQLTQGLVSAERYYPLLSSTSRTRTKTAAAKEETKPDISNVDVDVATICSIAFESVSFGYRSSSTASSSSPSSQQQQQLEGEEEMQVLHDVSFVLERGSVTALVGHNGSGKTTAAALLAGMHQPRSGRIVLSNGLELGSLSKKSRAQLIQVVPQSTMALFNMSILDNVRYCRPDASVDQVQRALAQAGCSDFVDRLAEGIQYVIGRGGCKLSGGQAQRLALARALLADPVIMIMDEPASNLDAAGETAVAEALVASQQHQQRAILIITHNPKSLELVDRILVMKDGSIVEAGTLTELRHPKSQLCHVMPDLLDENNFKCFDTL